MESQPEAFGLLSASVVSFISYRATEAVGTPMNTVGRELSSAPENLADNLCVTNGWFQGFSSRAGAEGCLPQGAHGRRSIPWLGLCQAGPLLWLQAWHFQSESLPRSSSAVEHGSSICCCCCCKFLCLCPDPFLMPPD